MKNFIGMLIKRCFCYLVSFTNFPQAFAIFIQHTSFQLYHCEFPRDYLRTVHDDGVINEAGVTLKMTPPYNFCDGGKQEQWFDIVVALVQYLQSGVSRVGFLNCNAPWNMLHKDIETQVEMEESASKSETENKAEDGIEDSSTKDIKKSTYISSQVVIVGSVPRISTRKPKLRAGFENEMQTNRKAKRR